MELVVMAKGHYLVCDFAKITFRMIHIHFCIEVADRDGAYP